MRRCKILGLVVKIHVCMCVCLSEYVYGHDKILVKVKMGQNEMQWIKGRAKYYLFQSKAYRELGYIPRNIFQHAKYVVY